MGNATGWLAVGGVRGEGLKGFVLHCFYSSRGRRSMVLVAFGVDMALVQVAAGGIRRQV
jgi:hypothetical protein